jgi:transcriptional regulator with XRE-family HTH domain
MEFNNRLYQLRKQKGLSQEELASRLNVSRQTVSKWEIGDSAPDMEKLIAMSELFDVSLDYLMLGKEDSSQPTPSAGSDFVTTMHEKVLTPQNKKRAKSALKIAGIIAGAILLIDPAGQFLRRKIADHFTDN